MLQSKSTFLLLIFFLCATNLSAQSSTSDIKLNQLGFYPNANKIAIVTGQTSENSFLVLNLDTKDIVFKGELGAFIKSKNSSLKTRVADFSKFNQQGNFILVVPGLKASPGFFIEKNALHSVAIASLKGYYYQRVSMALEKIYAGKWSRMAGHPDTAVLVHPSAASEKRPAEFKISSPGGWYDAGDYNKYIVNSGITMGTLLSAYEDYSAWFDTLKTNIPESGNKLPDILDEVLYNLRWMLTMQDPNDGGVYHKCTNAGFDGMVMPGITRLPRYVVQKGTGAALDFAAVMAQAARVLKKFERQVPKLSDSCLKAAISAWDWAIKNPSIEYDQNTINKQFEPKITTGAYGDKNFSDEWFWAATELLVTTGQQIFLEVVQKNIDGTASVPSWNNVYLMGYYTIVRFEKSITSKNSLDIEKIKKKIVTLADTLSVRVNESAFQTVMGQSTRDFVWGSNAVAANQGMILIYAYQISKNQKYLQCALGNLDYILGRNATGYCFVTGLGFQSPMHPHHRQSEADSVPEPVPGLLAGGPNPGRQDGCRYEDTEPEACYTDQECSYASNEIAINWNAPLVYLSNAVEAIMRGIK